MMMFRNSILSSATSATSTRLMRGKRSLRIQVQLDYHPSSQYAGIHLALKQKMYAKHGLDVVLVKPGQHGGDEPKVVLDKQAEFDIAGDIETISIGIVEQNVLVPAISNNVQVKAFASIFQTTPLILLALPGTKLDSVADLKNLKIGMHIDSTELMKTIVFHSKDRTSTVQTVQRADKMDNLLDGTVNAIQAYDCTEVIELQAKLGGKIPSTISVETLAAQSGVSLPLGYSQVIFAPTSVLRNDGARNALRTFVEVSMQGWKACEKDPSAAVAAVMESRLGMGYPPEVRGVIDENSYEFQRLSLARCLPYVNGSGGDQSHHIDNKTWQKASAAMASLGFISKTVPASLSLDVGVWPKLQVQSPSSEPHKCEITDGLSLARKIRSDVAKRSVAFLARTGRPPAITVISFGLTAASDEQRMSCFSTPQDSWWTKQHACTDAGITFQSIVLPITATPEDVKAVIMDQNNNSSVDAILLERGLKANMSVAVASSVNYLSELIAVEKDVDGERPKSLSRDGLHSLLKESSLLPSESQDGVLPCTVAGVLELMDHYQYSDMIQGANVVVIGRSRKLGLPLTLALIKRNATVTVCHSLTPHSELVRLCKDADYLFVAAGHPHLVNASMVKPAAVVINIGTTYCEQDGTLKPDVDPDVASVASVMTPTPHGVGSLPVAMLCYNTLVLAEAKARAPEALMKHHSAVPSGWTGSFCNSTSTPFLSKVVVCKDFNAAVDLVSAIRCASDLMDHHPTLSINSKRVCEQKGGCEVHVQVSTYSTKSVTEKDIQLASEINKLIK